LAPGDYTVTISAGGTCTAVETINVGNQVEYPSIPIKVDTATCGLNNGGLDLTINGGQAPFAIMWSTGDTSQDLTSLAADTFFVTVTSAVGCSNTNTVIVPNVNQPIAINEVVTDNISCALPNGSIDLNVSPADTNYVYTWSSGQTVDSLFSLTGGTYLVTVTLGVSCIALDTFSIIDQALPPDLATSATPATCGFNNGSVDLTINAGAPPFVYQWSNAGTDEDLNNMTPGTYSVTVTGANTCSAVASVNILNTDLPLAVSALPQENSSCAAPNGSLDISVNPAGAYSYEWSNSATSEDLSSLGAGLYTVTVTFGTCTGSNTFSIADNAVPPSLATSGTAANCGLANGAADLSVNAGVGPYTYVWSTNGTDEDLTDLIPGTYTVTVTGANACTEVSSVTVLNNNITLNLSTSTTANNSCTAFNGALDLSVTPAGTYSYQWSNTGNTEDLSGLDAGTYTVTVTLGTCQSTGTYVIDDNTQTPVITPNITAAICSVNNGAIDLNVSGPAGPFTYVWSNAATDQNLNALLPGTYTVTVSAPNGCTEVASINVPNNSNTFSLAGNAAPLTNCAANNGAINLNITPAGSYTYLWSNAATDEDLNGLAPGTYTVSVTESGSCTATATFFVMDQRTNPVTSQSLTPEVCGLADGAIDLSVSGGALPYSFSWSNAAVTEDLNNLGAGVYTVTVTDANNCTVTTSAVIPGNAISFALSGNATANSSCIANNGGVDLNVNPVGAYTYSWSNNTVSEDLVNVAAGTYTVTVSAGGNCTNTAAFNISSNVPTPVLSNTLADATCGAPTGSIDLTASGAPAPFGFIWSNGAVTEDLINLAAGMYTVTVTGGNGCTSTQSYTVQDDVFAPAIATSLTPATSCVVNNGAVNITVTPAGAYSFVWSNAAVTEDLNNVAPGTYTVTVSAGGACTSTASVTVTSNTPTPVLSNTFVETNCGLATGSIDLTVSGSQAPYIFLWSNAAVTEDLTGISAGMYTVTVTAGNGCTATQSVTVNDNVITPAIGSTVTADNACGTGNGAVDLSVTPAGNYTFSWSNGANTEDLGNLNAGAYTVTVSAGGTCTNTAVFQVADQSTNPQVNITSTGTALNCDVTSIVLTGNISGTNNPVTLQWTLSGSPLGGNATLTATAPGQYELLVVDNVTACSATTSISLTQSLNPPPLSVSNPVLLTCTTQSQVLTGSSTLGGVQFSWVTIVGTDTTILGSGPTLSVNTAGNYVLVGFNPANNCFNAVPVNVQANQTPPGAEAGQSFTLDCAGETLPLNGSGSGGANLGFQWATQDGNIVSGANSATPAINKAGTYTLTVTNLLNGCTATDAVTIEPEIPVAHVSVVQPTCQNLKGIIVVDSVTGLSNPILYSLNGGVLSSQSQFGNLDPGVYSLAVEGGNGCTATAVITVSAADLVEIVLDAEADIRLGYGHLINALVNIPTNELASVTWTPSDSLSCDTCLTTFATPVTTTRYQVHVVSEDGCEARSSILIRVDKTRHIYAPNIFSPDDDGNNDFFTLYADAVQVARIRSLRVYSRWGEEMYERLDFAPNEDIGWDGNFKGQKLNPGVFVWQAVVEFIDGQEELFTGDVTLLR
jgi:gliding motility-associated-like protein